MPHLILENKNLILFLNLKFNCMNNILKSSSKKVVFPLMMASAFWTGIPQTAYADALEIQTVMQTITVKGTVVDATGEPVIGASVLMKDKEATFQNIKQDMIHVLTRIGILQ